MGKLVKWTGCNCQAKRGHFSIDDIPLDCPATWRLIGSGCTVGIFQLEKKLGQEWSRKAKPESVDDLAALLSILRPGPLESGMAQDYVDTKFMKKKAAYLHPGLKAILERTFGALIYQEQSLRIAAALAGFSLLEADSLRKGLGKKDPKVIAELGEVFVKKAVTAGTLTKPQAEEIFSWIEKGQRYLFNKSHAVGYGMTAYQTAWLKCHFPVEFFAAYLTFSGYKGDSKEEVYKLVQDARLFGIAILPPEIRRRNAHFAIVDGGIAFGLSNIRSVGGTAIGKIASVAGKALDTWPQFLGMVPDLHRNVAEALVRSGACDCYEMPRRQMLAELEALFGTTTRDEAGNKVEVKGLTKKELEYFLAHREELGGTIPALLYMSERPPADGPKPMSKMTKPEVVAAIQAMKEYPSAVDWEVENNALMATKRKDLDAILKGLGYDPKAANRGCANDERRALLADRAYALETGFPDTNTAKANAEKFYLGIALSCSPADDADSSQATATCLDVARAPNGPTLSVVAIIDLVRHTKTKKGKAPGSPMCFLTLSDSTYSIDHAVVFPSAYEDLKHLCKEDSIVLVSGYKRDGSFLVQDMKKLL